MRITLIGPLPPPHGGIASHLERMMDYLQGRGHRVETLSPFGSSRTGHVKIHIARLPLALLRQGAGCLRHWHLTGQHRLLVMACCERLLPGPSVYTLHVDLDRVGSSDALLRWMLRPIDTVICVKEADARRIRERRLHGNVKVIPAYIPPQRPVEPEKELCSWLRAHSPAIVFMATHWGTTAGLPTYGLDLTLAGFENLLAHHPRAGLLALVPAKPRPSEQESLVADRLRTLGTRVRLVDRPVDLLAVMPAADLFVRPTRTDGDALSLREAASMGVRVVASDCVARPVPCRLFRSGSPADLTGAMLGVLDEPSGVASDSTEYADALLQEYQRLTSGS